MTRFWFLAGLFKCLPPLHIVPNNGLIELTRTNRSVICKAPGRVFRTSGLCASMCGCIHRKPFRPSPFLLVYIGNAVWGVAPTMAIRAGILLESRFSRGLT